jgi:ribosomal protein S27AE
MGREGAAVQLEEGRMNNLCPNCGAAYNVTPQHVGRQLACKKCGAMLAVKQDGIHLAEAEPIGETVEPVPGAEASEDYAVERAFPRRTPRSTDGGSTFVDFLTFRRMIVPIIIQILFWIGVLVCLVFGVVSLAGGTLQSVLAGLLVILIGPLVVRIYCELLIVIFRVNETLTDVRNLLKQWKKE